MFNAVIVKGEINTALIVVRRIMRPCSHPYGKMLASHIVVARTLPAGNLQVIASIRCGHVRLINTRKQGC